MNLFRSGRARWMVWFCATALSVVGSVSTVCNSADAEPAPAPAIAPVAPVAPAVENSKAEPAKADPKEASKEPNTDSKPETSAAASPAAPPITTFGPTTVSGPKPAFPIQSKYFEEVSDSYDEPYDAMLLERFSSEAILEALKGCTQDDLDQAAERDVTFRQMQLQPQNYRGHVVRLNGVLRAKNLRKVPKDLLETAPQAWMGQISDGKLNIISFVSMEPLPENMPLDNTGVTLSGVFLKRFAFLNNDVGEKATWGPLLFIRRVQPYSELAQTQTPTDPGMKVFEIVFSLLIAVALLAYGYTSMKTRSAGKKYFSQPAPKTAFPTSKGGGNRHFPRPK